jgi:hypothetical protein
LPFALHNSPSADLLGSAVERSREGKREDKSGHACKYVRSLGWHLLLTVHVIFNSDYSHFKLV